MEKLPMCRICLAKDVRMYVVINKDLRKLYEKLTDNPFVTEDHRPILACFFCCTKLKQCCRFQKQCLEAEELFSLMLNEDYEPNPSVKSGYLAFCNGFATTPVHHISIVDQNHNVKVKEELPDAYESLDDIIELKEEHQSYGNNEPEQDSENSCSDVEYKPALTFESDSEDDVSNKKRRADTKRASVAKKSKKQIQIIKTEDVVINEEQKTYEQTESRVTRAKVKNSSTFKNTTLDTSISNISDSDDNSYKISKKRIDTEGANEPQRQIDKRKRFKCDICQRGFSQKSHLNTHFRIHTGEKRYECGICLSAFTRIDLLYKHMHRHTGEKPFKCDICKRRFTQKANLKRHTLIHTGEKPYKCHLCHHSCNQKADLKKHIRIHTDEKPYKCDLCQHSCNQKGDLIIHFLRKHHTCNKPLKSKKLD